MPQKSFDAQVSDWVARAQERLDSVVKESARRLVGTAQTAVGAGGNMPILTGYLRSSLQVTIGGPVPASRARPEGDSFDYDAAAFVLTIAGAAAEETIFATYGANYARFVEEKRGFVRLAAMQWQTIISAVCRELQTSVEGRSPGG